MSIIYFMRISEIIYHIIDANFQGVKRYQQKL